MKKIKLEENEKLETIFEEFNSEKDSIYDKLLKWKYHQEENVDR